MLGKELPQNRAMTAGFFLAVAADGEVCLVGQRGEQVKEMRGLRLLHLSAKLSLEGLPRACVIAGAEGQSNQVRSGRQCGEPDVVEVAPGEVCFGHAAGRPTHGSKAEAFMRLARSAEADDSNGHTPAYSEEGRAYRGGGSAQFRVGMKPDGLLLRL